MNELYKIQDLITTDCIRRSLQYSIDKRELKVDKRNLSRLLLECSALFVVDLKLFRAIGAGDSLRSVYMALSRDKNSLANLDQDLPNFAQHEIPIYPLPQVGTLYRRL